jgi:iron-sulfur cluster assembly accessory protein
MTVTVEEPTTTNVIEITPAAAQRVQQLLEERSLQNHALRVFVGGGGCSGLQYGMGLDGEPRSDDLHFEFGEIQVIVDPQSIGYLQGATIDYVDDLMGGGFKIEDPNAVASCGCGHSFRAEGSTAPGDDAGGACC